MRVIKATYPFLILTAVNFYRLEMLGRFECALYDKLSDACMLLLFFICVFCKINMLSIRLAIFNFAMVAVLMYKEFFDPNNHLPSDWVLIGAAIIPALLIHHIPAVTNTMTKQDAGRNELYRQGG